jgi:hypothetical protein
MIQSQNNKPLLEKIDSLFAELKNTISHKMEKGMFSESIWGISSFDEKINPLELSKAEITKFQLENGIKIKKGESIIWNSEYKLEALKKSYVFTFTDVNIYIENLEDRITRCAQQYLPNQSTKFQDVLYHEINKLFPFINSKEGRAYYYKEKRQSLSNSHEHRYDVIWYYFEKFYSYPIREIRPNTAEILIDNEYPFIGMDCKKWAEFESAYLLIPLLNHCLDFINIDNGFINKHEPTYNISNVSTEMNRYPLVFKNAKSCELAIYIIDKKHPETKMGFSNYYHVFKRMELFDKKRLKPINYFDFIRYVFDEKIGRLREPLSNKAEYKLEEDFKKIGQEFDKEIANKINS